MVDGLAAYPGKEAAQQLDAWLGELSRSRKADAGGKLFEVALEEGDGRRVGGVAGVAANLRDGAKDADGAKLLENIRVAQDGGFGGSWFVMRLVRLDGSQHSGNFMSREASFDKNRGAFRDGIGDMVPP